MDHLFSHHNLVQGLSTLDEGPLSRADNFIENRLKSPDQDFGDNFIGNVTEDNGMVILDCYRAAFLGTRTMVVSFRRSSKVP